jgi:hypothetical protein
MIVNVRINNSTKISFLHSIILNKTLDFYTVLVLRLLKINKFYLNENNFLLK